MGGVFINSVGYEICYTARKIYQLLNKGLEPYGITPEQFVVIDKLLEEEGSSQKQLAEKLDKDANTVKAMVDKLERNGYVLRRRNIQDKRAFSLYLTAKAKEALPALRVIDNECMQAVYGDIDAENLQQLVMMLQRLRKNINKTLQKEHG